MWSAIVGILLPKLLDWLESDEGKEVMDRLVRIIVVAVKKAMLQ